MPPRPSFQRHADLCALARARQLPLPPLRPVKGECCGRLCEPCVWDYYDKALAKWSERHQLESDD